MKRSEGRLQRMTAQSKPNGRPFPSKEVRMRWTVLYILVRSTDIKCDTVAPVQRVLYILFHLARAGFGSGRFLSMPWTFMLDKGRLRSFEVQQDLWSLTWLGHLTREGFLTPKIIERFNILGDRDLVLPLEDVSRLFDQTSSWDVRIAQKQLSELPCPSGSSRPVLTCDLCPEWCGDLPVPPPRRKRSKRKSS